MPLGITLNIFPSSWQKSLGVKQRGEIKLIRHLARKTLCRLIEGVKKSPHKERLSHFSEKKARHENCLLWKTAETQWTLPAPCLEAAGRPQEGAQGWTSGIPCRSHQEWDAREGCLEHLHHHHTEKHTLRHRSLWSCPGAKGTAWGPCFWDSAPRWCLAAVWEKNHSVKLGLKS